jgi:hypothetical protein
MGAKSAFSTLRSATKNMGKEPEVPASKPSTTIAPAALLDAAMGNEVTRTAGPSGLPLPSGTTGMTPFSLSEKPQENDSELSEQGREFTRQDPEDSPRGSDRDYSQDGASPRPS